MEKTSMAILVIHGAGMNMRGKVQTEVFGTLTLPEYDVKIRAYAAALGMQVEIFHSNIEGEVINRLYAAHDEGIAAAIINPDGFTRGAARTEADPGEVTEAGASAHLGESRNGV
jgi:3-dehydroquinate dehydratase-2